jgi:1-phosphofructokinase
LQYFGRDDSDEISEDNLIAYCRQLLDKGCKCVALSMGGDGAIFVDRDGVCKASALKVEVRSTVGAGDSMCAALIHGWAHNMPARDCYALAIAASAAACTTEGTKPAPRELIENLLKAPSLTILK